MSITQVLFVLSNQYLLFVLNIYIYRKGHNQEKEMKGNR